MRAVCEVCGAPDRATQEMLLRSGQRELPDIGSFRAPFLCPGCGETLVTLLQGWKQAAAVEAIAAEREASGLPPLDEVELTAAARERWDRRAPVASPIRLA